MKSVDDAWRSFLDVAHGNRSLTRLVVLAVAVLVTLSILSPKVFFSPINFQTIAFSVPEVGLLSLAIMLAFITGGIDLSVVAVANLTALTTVQLFEWFDAQAAVGTQAMVMTLAFSLVGLIVAAVAGLFNGFLIAKVGITPILATLGTMQLYNGLAIVWTGGANKYGMPKTFQILGTKTLFGVPYAFLAFLVLAAGVAVLLNRTAIGTRMRLVGANPVASRYSGISNPRTLFLTYAVTGLLAGFAGIIIASRSASAGADYGSSYILLSIVIAILGGTNPMGGYGTVAGVVTAAIVLQMVSSGFNILRLSPHQYIIAQGVILVVVMILDVISRRRALRPKIAENQPLAASN